MNELLGVQPADAAHIWPDVSNLIAAACLRNGGRYSAEDYLLEISTGLKQLWLVRDMGILRAVVITEIVIFPQKKCGTIDVCTGEGLAEWKPLCAIIEQWMKDQGCQQMLLQARPGMERALPEYRKTHVILEKDL